MIIVRLQMVQQYSIVDDREQTAIVVTLENRNQKSIKFDGPPYQSVDLGSVLIKLGKEIEKI